MKRIERQRGSFDERERLRALDELGILDTPPEPTFDAIVEVAAALFEVPIALVTFIDGQRQWFKARHGLDVAETAREIAFCAHVVENGEPLVIPDAQLDARFATNPLVVESPGIRFYAGAPLVLSSGARVGSLALIDRVPRVFAASAHHQLERLARVVVDAIEQRVVNELACREAARAQKRADLENRRRNAILDAAPEGILLVDSGGRVLDLNPAAEEIFGRARDDALGRRVADAFVPCRPSSSNDPSEPTWVQSLLAADRSVLGRRLDVFGLDASGREFPMEVTAVSLPEAPPVFAVFVRDLTERRTLEATLIHAKKVEALGRLSGGIAHDFNNVLSVILSFTDLILDEMAIDDPCRDDVTEVAKAARRAADLTRQLLAFSRKQVLEPRVHVLDDLLANMGNMVQQALGPSVTLSWGLDSDHAKVRSDAGSIESVVVNLAINARHAMADHGAVRIATSRITLPEGPPGSLPGGDYVELVVSDSGCGMDDATQARLFEPFFTTKDAGGTGLGLSMVHAIVEQSRGAVRVRSELGAGTTFEILLPIVDGTALQTTAPSAAVLRPGSETILLVEDDDAIRQVLARMLSKHGYQVLVARSGAEALRVSDETASGIDVLLTDVVMPHMNGVELAERMVLVRPTIRVLCMTGFSEEHLLQRVTERGFGLLAKPITQGILTRRLRELLDEPAVSRGPR